MGRKARYLMPAHSLAEELVQKGKMRLLPPYNWSLRQVADEVGCSPGTVFKWRKQLEEHGTLVPEKPNTTDWTTEQKFAFVLESAPLNELELGEYCREQGLYPELLTEWKLNCIQANTATVKKTDIDTRGDRKRIKTLEKELNRKEKALAETAALLVLREKCNALWEKDEEQ